MRKATFCICENKNADQLQGNRKADQRLCFGYTDSTTSKLLAISSGCTAWFVSDLVRIQIVGFLTPGLIFFSISDKNSAFYMLMSMVIANQHK